MPLQADESASTESPGEEAIAPTPTFKRVWERVGAARYSTDENAVTFKVLSYNVLAQTLLETHSFLYSDCIPKYLEWDVRAGYLYEEITNLSPDILCLQEVQSTHLDTFYSKFEEIGYFGVFKKKTGANLVDGCAIYFRKSLFILKEVVNVELYQPNIPFLDRHQVGIIVKLSLVSQPDTAIVVANTHLLYNPRRLNIRLAQLKLFLAEIDRVAYDIRKSRYLPLILAGDFNAYPESDVISFLDNGMKVLDVVWDFSYWKKLGITDNCQHLAVYLNRLEGRPTNFSELSIYNSEYSAQTGTGVAVAAGTLHCGLFSGMFGCKAISHPFRLFSVYEKVKKCQKRQIIGPHNYDGPLVVDYIYYSGGSGLRAIERLRPFTEQECDAFGHLPNKNVASDHHALAAIFELKPKMAKMVRKCK